MRIQRLISVLAQIGWGTLISLVSRTQQQSILFVFALAMQAISPWRRGPTPTEGRCHPSERRPRKARRAGESI
jgi:hypothetical protein